MNLSLPIRSAGRRNDESRAHFTNYTPPSSTEAIAGPIREPAPLNDRLIVGLDFGTTYSGYVKPVRIKDEGFRVCGVVSDTACNR